MFVTFLCSNTQKLSQNCFFFHVYVWKNYKIKYEGGRVEGELQWVSQSKNETVSSFELKSSNEGP